MKVRSKIGWGSTLLFLIIFLLTGGVVSFFSTGEIREQVYQRLEGVNADQTAHLEDYIELSLGKMKLVSSRTKLRNLLKEHGADPTFEKQDQMRGILKDALVSDPTITSITILDDTGEIVVSTNQISEGKKSKNWDIFKDFRNESGALILNDGYERPNLYFVGPIVLDQSWLGLIFVKTETTHLNEILRNRVGLGETGESYLVNREGYFLTPPFLEGEKAVLAYQVETENVRVCFEEGGQSGSGDLIGKEGAHLDHEVVDTYIDYRSTRVIGTHRFLAGLDVCLLTEMDYEEAVAPSYEILRWYIVVGALGLVGFWLLSLLLAGQISRPLLRLSHGIQMVEKGDLEHRVATKGRDEIADLSRAFDRMVGAVKESRAEIDRQVGVQTKELADQSKHLTDQQTAILNILEDVDEDKRRASEERDRVTAILEGIGDGVFVVNQNLEIVVFNRMAQELSGYSFKEAIGKKYDQVLNFVFEKNEKKNDRFVKEAIKTGRIKSMANHTLLIKKDGTKIPVADSAAPLKNEAGEVTGCVVVFRDVTKERKIDQMKNEFISLASHQLRTPLSAMKWFGEMLLNGDVGKLKPEQSELVQNIYDSNERMIDLVNSLLNISRIESGRLIIDPQPTEIKELVEGVVTESKKKIEEKKLKFTLSVHESLPKVNIDPKLVRNVFQNLLTNAIKYTPEKGEVTVMVSKNEKEIIAQVSDTGAGIPKKEQDRVFQKFYRGENIVKLETEGNGLGLYLAQAVIQSSGGKIWFESEEGKGTTFWFTLPLKGSKAKAGEVSLS